ncbi:MAG: hypothetical protein KGY80_02355 [Candidatus Thorarchaeota archaeon]|nr:hypothetical protein [Candidatus Thorarchaeota archaeon]
MKPVVAAIHKHIPPLLRFETLIILSAHLLIMSKFEMLEESLLGNLGERIPYSLWQHHPRIDRTPEGLAKAEIEFMKKYDVTCGKISFHGRYPVVDWGCEAVYDGATSGSTTCKSCAVEKASDWEELEPVDVNAGEFGKQVQAIELIQDYAEGRVPIMATIFDAPMVASKLCDGQFVDFIEKRPELMHSVLDMLTDVMIDFARATLQAGSHGLFIASQHSTTAAVTDRQYANFVFPYEKKLISKLRGRAKFIVLHLHAREEGETIRFEKVSRLRGVSAINWEDQSAFPSLAKGKKVSRKAVFGGIDHNNTLRKGTPDEIEEQVLEAAQAAGLRKLILAPGCVIPIDTPPENLKAVVDTVKAINPWSQEWEEYA